MLLLLFNQFFVTSYIIFISIIFIYLQYIIREILEADADAIVLSKWNPFYYEIGMHVRKFNDRDSEQITESLLQVNKLVKIMIVFSLFLVKYLLNYN